MHDPANYEALYDASVAAARAHPASAPAQYQAGSLSLVVGRPAEGIEFLRAALAIDPDHAQAWNNLGAALRTMGSYEEAYDALSRAVALAPDYTDAQFNLGCTLSALRRPAEAIAYFQAILARDPNHANAHNALGVALWTLGRHDEAMERYKAALALQPNHAEAYANAGNVLNESGRTGEARQAFEKAIALAPQRPAFYRHLFSLRPVAPGDPHLAALEDLARSEAAMTRPDRIELHFTLGKAYADLGQRQRSLRHYIEGNALKRATLAYDESKVFAYFEDMARAFPASFFERHRPAPSDAIPAPIFIVGMPRSGTTLIEQILASHPAVFGGGELIEFELALTGDAVGVGAAMPPERMAALGNDEFRDVGRRYLDKLRAFAPGTPHVTDKMPSNFGLAGAILAALPNAKIVHARRDAVDTCLSCFAQLFGGEQPFTYDLGELGRYYRAYERLMEHWAAVLPRESFLEVRYETLVDDFEAQTRRLVAFCGLPWDDACLSFHKTQRTVITASVNQVRKPIYRTSIGRWREREPLLQTLYNALRD
jgi:tetratricopeptide (TPR) repeat protein